MVKKILLLVAAVLFISGFTAQSAFAGKRGAKQAEEPLKPTITLPSGKVIDAPILDHMPSDEGWLADIDEGLKLAGKEDKKVLLLYALSFRNNHGLTKGYMATYRVEQPEFREAVKDKYILVYYWQETATPELRSRYKIADNSQMDMIILDKQGRELAREKSPGPDVDYLVDFVNSVK